MKIFLAGLPEHTDEQELRKLLSRYVELQQIELLPGDEPEHSLAMLTIRASNAEAHWATRRLTGLYWKGHTLRAYVSLFSGENDG